LGVPEADTADGCQDVFVVLHRRWAALEQKDSLRAWVYGVCVRIAADRRRSARARRELLHEALPDVPILADQDLEVERNRRRAWLVASLDGLGADKRAVFVLYELEELTMTEVAEAVGCPLQTAYSRLYAARRDVAAFFARNRSRSSS